MTAVPVVRVTLPWLEEEKADDKGIRGWITSSVKSRALAMAKKKNLHLQLHLAMVGGSHVRCWVFLATRPVQHWFLPSMASSRLYKRYLQLFNQWPLDVTKGRHRDLGQHLRDRVAVAFDKGEATTISDVAKCEAVLASLERIANDTYFLPEDRKIATSTGLSSDVCSLLTSEEGLKQLAEGKVDFLSAVKEGKKSDQ